MPGTAENLPPPPVTRFAPSPTGYLHIGHVVSAVYVWGLGRALGGRVLLRIEDHDRGRCRPEFERVLFEDLAWLGLHHDNDDLRCGSASPYRQSDSLPTYAEALERLAERSPVFGCDCSRSRLAALPPRLRAAAADDDDGAELRYDGHCRALKKPCSPPNGARVVLPEATLAFTDLALGEQRQVPADQCGDLLLRDRHGNYTYQFAVTVDDQRQGVTLVIRGRDLTHATGRQLWLARQLGRTEDARFLHHPLVLDVAGRKLGKRVWSEAIASRRARGEAPEVLLGEAAHLAGLAQTPRPLAAAELPALFKDWEGALGRV